MVAVIQPQRISDIYKIGQEKKENELWKIKKAYLKH